MSKQADTKKPDVVTWIVFVISFGVVIITITSAIFPAVILGSMSEFPKYPMDLDVYELGVLAYPIIVTNAMLGILAILYIKKKLPPIFSKSIKSTLDFEMSSKRALVAMMVILGIYIGFTANEVFQGEQWEDYTRTVEPKLQTWSTDEFFHIRGNPLSYFLLTTSMSVFGNYKVLAFISSIASSVLVYFIAHTISGKRLAGLVALGIVLSSTIFLTYDTSITYPSFWVLFYLLSLFTVYRAWPLSPVFFMLAILSKPLAILFIPMTLFYTYRSEISQKKKVMIMASYGIILAMMVLMPYFSTVSFAANITFDSHEFWSGFTTISSHFRFDGFILIFLLPLVVGLFVLARNGNRSAESVMVLILGMLLLAPVISGLSTYTNNPYRFVPLVFFFAMGVGMIFSSRASQGAALRSSES